MIADFTFFLGRKALWARRGAPRAKGFESPFLGELSLGDPLSRGAKGLPRGNALFMPKTPEIRAERRDAKRGEQKRHINIFNAPPIICHVCLFGFTENLGNTCGEWGKSERVVVISAKNHKRQSRKRQSVTAKREKERKR